MFRGGAGGFARVYSARKVVRTNSRGVAQDRPTQRLSHVAGMIQQGAADRLKSNKGRAKPCSVRRGCVSSDRIRTRPGLIPNTAARRCEAIPSEPIASSLARSLRDARSYDSSNSRAYQHTYKHSNPKTNYPNRLIPSLN